MITISRKRISEILRLVFDLLWFEPEGLYVRDIFEHLNKFDKISDEEKGYYSAIPGFQLFEVIVRVGSIPLEKAGWLVKTRRGRWFLTEKGRKESKRFLNAEEFFLQAIEYYEDWRRAEEVKLEGFDSLVRERAEERAWEQISTYLKSLQPKQFLDIIAELFKSMGYFITWMASAESTSGPAHMIASLDPLGINDKRIVVHLNLIGQATTQDGLMAFSGTLKENDHGVFISTGGFTKSAINYGSEHGNSNLYLIDLDKLVELWVSSMKTLSPEAKDMLPLKPVYFLAFSDHQDRTGGLPPGFPNQLVLQAPKKSSRSM